MTTEIKSWLAVGLLLIVCAAFGWYTIHERHAGETVIEKEDAKAQVVAQKEAVAETDANIAKADAAALGAEHDQTVINDYLAAHPIGAVRVCNADNRVAVLPQGRSAGASSAASGAGSVAGGQVPAGSDAATADISPELDTIVRSFGAMAIDVREFQARQ